MSHFGVHSIQTLGFLLCKQLFSIEEMQTISTAFDVAMRKPRGDAVTPELEQDERGYSKKRQQVVPFFDYDPEVFYPLLDDERLMDIFDELLGEDSSDECDCGHFVTTFGKTGSKTCKNRQVSLSVLMAVKSLNTMEVHVVQQVNFYPMFSFEGAVREIS